MKTLLNNPFDPNNFSKQPGILPFIKTNNRRVKQIQTNNLHASSAHFPGLAPLDLVDLIKPDALYQMYSGQIPDLTNICYSLYNTFSEYKASYSAVQFIPVLKNMLSIDPLELERFLQNPETNHVLVQNELLKIVLIHWEPGKFSNIHGHPAGGCVFKVLQGRLEEKRYTPDENADLLAVSTMDRGGMGYIDDHMAYHAVGNPFSTPAVSLHAYTPGIKK